MAKKKLHSPAQGREVASSVNGAPPRRASAPGLWIFFQPVDHKKGEKLSVDFIDIFAAPPAIAIAGGAAV